MNRQQGRRRGHNVFYGCGHDDIAKAIVVCEGAGKIGHAELFREMRKGGLALVAGFNRPHAVTAADLEASRHPTLVVVSDADYHATGPILRVGYAVEPIPPRYLAHLHECLRSRGFIAVYGDDLDAVADVVETLNAAAEMRQ